MFFAKKKRDLVMSNSPRLAGYVDPDGRPTAGICLEIRADGQIPLAVQVWYKVGRQTR